MKKPKDHDRWWTPVDLSAYHPDEKKVTIGTITPTNVCLELLKAQHEDCDD